MVNLFYFSILIFSVILSICIAISFLINKHSGKIINILIPWNCLSIIGLILIFFEVTRSKQVNLQVFFFTVAFSLLIFQIAKQVFDKMNKTRISFIWLSALSFSASFFIRDFLDAVANL